MTIALQSITENVMKASPEVQKHGTVAAKLASVLGVLTIAAAASMTVAPNAHAGDLNMGTVQGLAGVINLIQRGTSDPNNQQEQIRIMREQQNRQDATYVGGALANGQSQADQARAGLAGLVGGQLLNMYQGRNQQPQQQQYPQNNGYQQGGYNQAQVVYGQPIQHVPSTNIQGYQGQVQSQYTAQIQNQLNQYQQSYVNAGLSSYGSPEQQQTEILKQTGRLVASSTQVTGGYQVAYNNSFVQQTQGLKAFQEGYQTRIAEIQRTTAVGQQQHLNTGYGQ